MRLTSNLEGAGHRATIPADDTLRVGTFAQLLNEVASYVEPSRDELVEALFR